MPSRTSRFTISAALAAILLTLPLTGGPRLVCAAGAAEEKPAASEPGSTTQRDQTDLSVTVYNSNLALVRDIRQIRVQSGVFPLRFEDVAANIMPQTVHFRSLTDAAKLGVLEQNYEYDLLDQNSLLRKFLGRDLLVTRGELQPDGKVKPVVSKGTLISDNNGQTVWKIGDEIVTNAQPYSYPNVPADLYSHPTLIWTLENRGADAQKVEASYLTGNMNWSADYVLTVSRDEKSADLDGWVTLVNNSGVAYNNARLQLVAGNVHREALAGALQNYEARDMVVAAAKAAPFEQENFSEYHLYTLERRTSIQNSETKQISLLSGTNIPVEKYLSVEGQQYWFRNPQGIGNPIPQPVKVFYRFRNDQKSNLGMPLPAGTVRVYQADSKGALQFSGENAITHTPKDEDVRIYVGDAFDVVCERKAMDYRKIASNVAEFEYQVALRNHKDGPVIVEVREPVGGDWEVVNSNYKWTKLDASTLSFSIPVEKNSSATLDYRVRVKW